MRQADRIVRVVLLGAACGVFALLGSGVAAQSGRGSRTSPAAQQTTRDRETAAAAFEAMVPVLHHPRCMNCHSSGDFPRQGDDRHPHTMDVRRGPEGHGANGVVCGTCHQDHNLAGLHVPPGAPGWALPSPAEPMVWEGLSDSRLCQLFKDPHQNGGRTLQQIEEHMSTPLVMWGWDPGAGRTPIPMRREDFLASVRTWVSHGGGCP